MVEVNGFRNIRIYRSEIDMMIVIGLRKVTRFWDGNLVAFFREKRK